MGCQFNLPHGTKQNRKSDEENENKKSRCSEETVQSQSPWSQSVSPEAGKQSIVGKTCERGRFQPGLIE